MNELSYFSEQILPGLCFLFSIFVAVNNIEINEAPFNDIHVSDVFVL